MNLGHRSTFGYTNFIRILSWILRLHSEKLLCQKMSVHVTNQDDSRKKKKKIKIFIRRISCCCMGITKCCVIWCKLTPFVTFSRHFFPSRFFSYFWLKSYSYSKKPLKLLKTEIDLKCSVICVDLWQTYCERHHCFRHLFAESIGVTEWNLSNESFDVCPFSAVARFCLCRS